MMLVFLAALAVMASGQATLGCTPLTDANPFCLAEVCVDVSMFGTALVMSITDMSSTPGTSFRGAIGG